MLVVGPWPGVAKGFWASVMPFLSPTAFFIISSLIISISFYSISDNIPLITLGRAFTLFSERAPPQCRIGITFLSHSFFKNIFPVHIYFLLFRSLFPLSSSGFLLFFLFLFHFTSFTLPFSFTLFSLLFLSTLLPPLSLPFPFFVMPFLLLNVSISSCSFTFFFLPPRRPPLLKLCKLTACSISHLRPLWARFTGWYRWRWGTAGQGSRRHTRTTFSPPQKQA